MRSLPVTVSPIWNAPLIGVTSISFGTVKLLLSDISVLENELKNLVPGFSLYPVNEMFCDLRFGIEVVSVITSVTPKPPSILLNSLSTHTSSVGFINICPNHVTTSYGLTFMTLLANG